MFSIQPKGFQDVSFSDFVSILYIVCRFCRQSPFGTAMHLAAAKGHVRCLELLGEHGGLLLARDKKGETVLQLAERTNQEDVIHYIARHSAQNPEQIKVNEIIYFELSNI